MTTGGNGSTTIGGTGLTSGGLGLITGGAGISSGGAGTTLGGVGALGSFAGNPSRKDRSGSAAATGRIDGVEWCTGTGTGTGSGAGVKVNGLARAPQQAAAATRARTLEVPRATAASELKPGPLVAFPAGQRQRVRLIHCHRRLDIGLQGRFLHLRRGEWKAQRPADLRPQCDQIGVMSSAIDTISAEAAANVAEANTVPATSSGRRVDGPTG